METWWPSTTWWLCNTFLQLYCGPHIEIIQTVQDEFQLIPPHILKFQLKKSETWGYVVEWDEIHLARFAWSISGVTVGFLKSVTRSLYEALIEDVQILFKSISNISLRIYPLNMLPPFQVCGLFFFFSLHAGIFTLLMVEIGPKAHPQSHTPNR